MSDVTAFVTYAPYLPLKERCTVGAWELIPRSALVTADAADTRSFELAAAFAEMFELPGREPFTHYVGAFGRPSDRRVGDEPESAQVVADLRHALTAAVLSGNPSPLAPADPNAGHYMLTTESAAVTVGGINREGAFTTSVWGSWVPYVDMGIPVLPDPNPSIAAANPVGRIPALGAVRIPAMGPYYSTAYADSVWHAIRRPGVKARRLTRAIEWLALSQINADPVTADLRIPALRAGFEVLFDSDESLKIAGRLTKLVEPDDTERALRAWRWKPGAAEHRVSLTSVAWWFVRLCQLRNTIMHGGVLTQDDWRHEGRSHTRLAAWYLREAIEATVAATDPKVEQDRALRRAVAGLLALHQTELDGPTAETSDGA